MSDIADRKKWEVKIAKRREEIAALRELLRMLDNKYGTRFAGRRRKLI